MSETTFKRLEERMNSFYSCIRCGYCYEHCPVYKHTGWESDTPRAKLIMLYGMVSGNLAPSEYIAEKMFDCYYCKRCASACSGGVPITDIFTDARADLIDAGFDVTGTTSVTDHSSCSSCLACVRTCKHDARYVEENADGTLSGRILVDKVKCQACGACLDVCPRSAISVKSYGTGHEHLDLEIKSFLNDESNPEAKAVVFCCNWSNYPGFQNSILENGEENPEYKILVNVCAGRLKTETILEAFKNEAWGVLVTGCPEDECEHDGNERAEERIFGLKLALKGMGVDPNRVRLTRIAKGDQAAMSSEIASFMEEVREIGPLK